MGRFVFLFTSMQAQSFSPTSEFTGSSIKAKCKPMKKYKGAHEKHTSKPVKSPYGVGRYCEMAVSPTRSHLLWVKQKHLSSLQKGRPCLWRGAVSEGQLISKAIYGLLTSTKKRTDEFVLFAFLVFTANKSNSSVRFLGESTAH